MGRRSGRAWLLVPRTCPCIGLSQGTAGGFFGCCELSTGFSPQRCHSGMGHRSYCLAKGASPAKGRWEGWGYHFGGDCSYVGGFRHPSCIPCQAKWGDSGEQQQKKSFCKAGLQHLRQRISLEAGARLVLGAKQDRGSGRTGCPATLGPGHAAPGLLLSPKSLIC